MAKNQSGDMNGSFDQGSLDGTYKRIDANQAGQVADPNKAKREAMPWRNGFEQADVGYRPDNGAPIALRPPK